MIVDNFTWLRPSSKLYKKKPIVVRAVQIGEEFSVLTEEGKMTGRSGDYLIEGIQGELYPCRKDIFERTYELVEED